MKILHVLTLVAPGNPFGGPVSVALNQAAELRSRGHHVDLVAAQPSRRRRGKWTSTGAIAWSSWQVVPGAGFSGLVSPGLYHHVRRSLRTYDVVHVHMSRDLVTLPIAALARRRGLPYVVQAHGMIDASARRSAAVLDRIWTTRVMGEASAVLALTEHERRDVELVMRGGAAPIEIVPNGVGLSSKRQEMPAGPVRFLFCSRLHQRKRPVLFARAAIDLMAAGVSGSYRIVGADEGELQNVTSVLTDAPSAGMAVDGPVEPDEVAGVLDSAHVLVLPSVDEPFPMVVIEAMSRGRAVVVTESCGLAAVVQRHHCGLVVAPDDQQALTSAMASLAEAPELVEAMGRRGIEAVAVELGIGPVVDRLEAIYEAACRDRRAAASSTTKST